MSKWNLIVDVAECHNCNNCFLTCKDEYVGNDHPGYSAAQPLHGHEWIKILAKERGKLPIVDTAFVPTMCNHCDDAPCIAAGEGAVKKREDGIVMIDPELAKGRRDLVDSCPYGAIWWNAAADLPQAWTFDAHLLDRDWPAPRCVQACPTGALRSVNISDEEMARMIRADGLEPLRPDLNTKPRVHYKNLHLYRDLFIAGSVIADRDGVVDCLADARITLTHDGIVIQSARSDAFGEFKFDGLAPNSGPYGLQISHPDWGTAELTATLDSECVVFDAIALST